MFAKIDSDGEAKIPQGVMDRMRARPGDRFEFVEDRQGYKLRLRRKIRPFKPPLQGLIPPDHEPFDIHVVRERMMRPYRPDKAGNDSEPSDAHKKIQEQE